MNCVVFTNNKGKLAELQLLLKQLQLTVFGYKDITYKTIDVVEDGVTFEENAFKKVRALAKYSDDILIADDSGLEIEALNNEPGVYSARYGGPGLTDHQRCLYVLEKMKSISNRRARFQCVLAIIMPDKSEFFVQGTVEGTLSESVVGNLGFGYDPIFIPKGYLQTFGELGSEIKQTISHRGQAMQKLKDKLSIYISS